jgi:glutamate-ammonia-ligase adenylyltransferase
MKLQTVIETIVPTASPQAKQAFNRLASHIDADAEYSNEFWHLLLAAIERSDYCLESLIKYPALLEKWSKPESDLYQTLDVEGILKRLDQACESVCDEASLMRALRVFRQEHQARMIWRNATVLANLDDILLEVSALANACIRVALQYVEQWASEKYGQPLNAAGVQQHLVVLGMGKLGAHELNISSDIDLIFAYPEAGATNHPSKPIDNHLFFSRVGQRLIHVLDQVTAEGFVYRVDMRLRPYGSSGALALNFAAFDDYFQSQGREWERFAMIKARAITGPADDVEQLMSIIRPFVYRGYSDFSSFDALREMKRLIMSEVHRKGGQQNIKLGAGGIREVEFIAQATQLIYGGRDARLQDTGLQTVFDTIKAQAYLPAEWVDQLLVAYRFLRDLEHAIQGLADKQTQLLPASEREQAQVCMVMQQASWAALLDELDAHRERVSDIFEAFLSLDTQGARTDAVSDGWRVLWQIASDKDAWLQALEEAGYDAPAQTYQAIEELRQLRQFNAMSREGRERFENFLPRLLSAATDYACPSLTFTRALHLVRAILGRSIYFVLLNENTQALTQLCRLCSESAWFAEHIAKSPIILDDLLNPSSLYSPPQKIELSNELRQSMLRIPEGDLEASMDCLRNYKQSHLLRVAAAEITGSLPVMKVSDYLTWIAEVSIDAAIEIAWRELVVKHGWPSELEDGTLAAGFAVIAYGKLGGIELGYASDLDMVFLYDVDDFGFTNGPKPINNQLFYTRLGQKVIHILATQTTQGCLYEVDMRLRPSGNSGMLVSSLKAFEKYQADDAWTWEHQALVRARAIAGDLLLMERFAQVRQGILSQQRDAAKLREEVLLMRDKMRAAAIEKFGDEASAANNIKQGRGGLIDIEFITQYLVLAWADTYPELCEWSDNVRLLEQLAQPKFTELIPAHQSLPILIDAYRTLRAALHTQVLSGERYAEGLRAFPEPVQAAQTVWEKVMFA